MNEIPRILGPLVIGEEAHAEAMSMMGNGRLGPLVTEGLYGNHDPDAVLPDTPPLGMVLESAVGVPGVAEAVLVEAEPATEEVATPPATKKGK